MRRRTIYPCNPNCYEQKSSTNDNVTIANGTCGTRGGPGYRDPATGQCVSWERFSYVCGPDGSRCQPEQVNPLTKELQNGADPRNLTEQSHGSP
jgi:hypothetical protein